MTLLSMKDGVKNRVFVINEDGTAEENGVKIGDFADYFLMLRWSDATVSAELEIPVNTDDTRTVQQMLDDLDERRLRKERKATRMPQLSGFRREWSNYENMYADNFSMD